MITFADGIDHELDDEDEEDDEGHEQVVLNSYAGLILDFVCNRHPQEYTVVTSVFREAAFAL